MSMHTQRLRTLEATLGHVRCDTCREWPALAILFDDAPLEHPNTCPDCGRDCTPSNNIRFVTRDDGPQ